MLQALKLEVWNKKIFAQVNKRFHNWHPIIDIFRCVCSS
jgi:hypothetical protein